MQQVIYVKIFLFWCFLKAPVQESTKLIMNCHIWRWPIIQNSKNPAGKVLSRLCFGKWGVLLAFHITHKVFYILFFYFSTINFDQFSNGSGILENSENREPNRSQNWRTGTGLNRTFGSVLSVLVLCISSELNFGNTSSGRWLSVTMWQIYIYQLISVK